MEVMSVWKAWKPPGLCVSCFSEFLLHSQHPPAHDKLVRAYFWVGLHLLTSENTYTQYRTYILFQTLLTLFTPKTATEKPEHFAASQSETTSVHRNRGLHPDSVPWVKRDAQSSLKAF